MRRLLILHSSFAAQPLNVLFIAVNDLCPELGCHGAAHMKTPHGEMMGAHGYLTHLRSTQTNLSAGYKPKVQRLREAEAKKKGN